MSIIDDAIFTEIRNKTFEVQTIKRQLDVLPKGTLFFRRTGTSVYVYRKWKENKKVVSEYLGKVNKESVKEEINKSNDRKILLRKYRKAEKELAELQKLSRTISKKIK